MTSFSESARESVRASVREGSRQEHGAWNREHGTGSVGPKVPSIVTVRNARSASTVSVAAARARDAWMGLRP